MVPRLSVHANTWSRHAGAESGLREPSSHGAVAGGTRDERLVIAGRALSPQSAHLGQSRNVPERCNFPGTSRKGPKRTSPGVSPHSRDQAPTRRDEAPSMSVPSTVVDENFSTIDGQHPSKLATGPSPWEPARDDEDQDAGCGR